MRSVRVCRGRARSYLFVPAQRPERIAKAFAAAADMVIVDLEDAVPPAVKDSARDALVSHLRADRPVIVRINAIDTPWYAADVEACRHPGVAAVMLPKAEDPTSIVDLAARIGATAVDHAAHRNGARSVECARDRALRTSAPACVRATRFPA